jgi:hypothetical protein
LRFVHRVALISRSERFSQSQRAAGLLSGGNVKPPRTIRSNSTVSSLFLNRYAPKRGGDPRLELTLNVLSESFKHQEVSTEPAEPPKFANPLPLDKQETLSRLDQRFKKSHKLTSIELLDALCSRLESELLINYFDYLSMHARCVKVLRETHTSLGNKPFEKFPDNPELHQGRDEQLPPQVRGFILMAVYATATHFSDMGEEQKRRHMRWMAKVSEIIEKVAKTEGDAELEKIEEILEGSLERTEKYSVKDIGLMM